MKTPSTDCRAERTRSLSKRYAISCLLLPLLWLAQDPVGKPAADAQIDAIMQARFVAGDFDGVVLVARRGKILYQHSFGLANREWHVLNDLETKFEIGSMTKQFTAMLVLQMVNEGRLRLAG